MLSKIISYLESIKNNQEPDKLNYEELIEQLNNTVTFFFIKKIEELRNKINNTN
jgi:hypothetical protein